ICLIRFLCGTFPRFSFCSDSLLSQSHEFRDQVLARTSRGQHYTQLYYKLSPEAVGIMMLNPMLVLRSREVMERYMPIVSSMLKGEPVTITRGDLTEIDGFLRGIAEKGS